MGAQRTHLTPRAICWNRRDIFNSPDPHPGSRKSPQSTLRAWPWGLGARTAGSAELDVESCDPYFAAADGNILGG